MDTQEHEGAKMICYMPFTYVEDRCMHKLQHVFGSVAIYNPNPGRLPEHMRIGADQGMLKVRCPRCVQADQLTRAVREFKLWADLHQGNIADMAGYFKSRKGRPPLLDDTSPRAIGDQIRKFGRPASSEPEDPVFQAALFLAMAQEYDFQHDAVNRDLQAVSTMEQAMLTRLAGDPQDEQQGLGAPPGPGNVPDTVDTGAFMTSTRIQAWAELAARDLPQQPFVLFLTSSRAVFDYLLDRFASAEGPFDLEPVANLDADGETDMGLPDTLNALACTEDPAAWLKDHCSQSLSGTKPADLSIYVLKGIRSAHFPEMILGTDSTHSKAACTGREPVNTLIGMMER